MATDTLNGLNIVFPIYNEDGTPFHNLVLRKSVVDSVVMSLGDKITGDVYYKDNTLAVTMREYIEYKHNPDDENEEPIRYSLVNPPTIVREGLVADNGELKGMTKYSFEFYHPMYQLSNFPFTDVATKTGEEKYLSQNKSFSWIGKPQDYIDKLNKNLEGTQWYVRKSSKFPQDKDNELSEVLTFDNVTIADAIKTGYETWDIPYIVSEVSKSDPLYAQNKRFVVEYGLPSNEIYASEADRQTDNPYVFRFGQGVGLKNNSRTPRNNKIVTRIAGYGSEDNVPYGYPQIVWTGNQNWDYTKNNDPNDPLSYPIYKGIVGGQYVKLIKHPFTRTHLMPSIYTETVNKKVNPNAVGYNPNIEIKDYYDAIATQEYHYTNEINPQAPSYESHEFADIKPELDADRDTGIVSAVPLNADLTPADHWDDSMDDDGNYLQSFFQITLPQLSFDLYACAAITQEMQINMRSGDCIGCTFTVQVDWEDYKKNFYDSDGNFVPDGDQRDLTKYPKSNLGQISVVVQKDNSTFGTLMPNIYQQPKAEDLFVFIGISLPTSYITNAEVRLDAAMKSYMLENNVYYFDYPLKFDEDFLTKHEYILSQIRPNSIIRFEYGEQELQLFVKQLTVKYNNTPLPQFDITLTDNVEVVLNQIGQVADDVDKLSSLIAILRQSYSRNVWTELANKLSKTQDDTAKGWITILKGVRTLSDFIELSRGGALYTDEDTLAHLTTDVARIRERILGSLRIGDTSPVETEPTLHVGGNTLVDNDLQVHEGLLVEHDAEIVGILKALNHIYTNLLTSNNYTDDSAFGQGFSLSMKKGNENRSYLVVDELFVRWKAIFNELEIRRISYSGGNRVSSHAASKIVKVKDIVKKLSYSVAGTVLTLAGQVNVVGSTLNIDGGVTVNGTTATLTTNSVTYAKRCYAMKDDGTTATMNWWRVNDQARCQTFNIVERGTYQKASNKSYWRRVLAVGYEKIEIDGTLSEEAYDYVDLSVADCMTGSDLPEAGDTIVQMGNRTDTSRQGFIVSEVAGTSAPDIQIFRNINSYTLEGKRKIILSPDETHLRVNSLVIETEYDAQRVPMERGDWEAIPEHKCYYYDLVQYNGSSWLCIFPESGTGGVKYTTEPPSETSIYWQIYAQKGADGKDGKDGKSFNILGSYDTEEELIAAHPTGQVGDAYIVAGYLYVWDEENDEWHNSGQIKGDTGRGISSVTISYGKSNSSTKIPRTWYSSVDAVGLQAGDYLFTRMVYVYTEGEPAQSEPIYSIGYIGRDGSSPVVGDIDNEMISVACDKDGKVLAEFNKTISVKMFNGSTAVTLKDISVSSASGITIDQVSASNGTFRVHIPQNNTISQSNNFTVTATANIGGADVSRVMSFVVNGVRQGADGTPATIYDLIVSLSSIKKSKDGTPSVATITATRQKTVGSTISDTTDGTLTYKIDGGSEQTYSGAIQTSSISTGIEFIFKVNGTVVDRETVPVIMDGQDGKSVYIDSQSVTYSKQSQGNLDPTKLTYGSYPSSLSKGDWLYTKTTVVYKNSDGSTAGTTSSYSVSYIGTDGNNGVGISGITEHYKASANSTGEDLPSTGDWGTNPSPSDWNINKPYLWNYEKIAKVDKNGNTTYERTTPSVVAIFTKGISSVVNHYVATSKSSGVTKQNPSDGTWTNSVQNPTSTKRYLWNYETTEYSNGQSTETDPHIICVYGEKGDKGNTGAKGDKGDKGDSVSVDGQNSKTEYVVSDQGISAPTSGWKTTIPSVPQGQYLWTKVTTAFTDGNSTVSYGVSYRGTDGDDVQIDTSRTYVRYSTVKTASQPADSTFTLTTPPQLSEGDYLWSLSQTAYVGVSSVLKSYSVSRLGIDGDEGDKGADGYTTHFAYATSADGSQGFSTTNFNGATYIGTYRDQKATDSTNYRDYTWTEWKGEKGDKGDSITKASADTYRYAIGDSGITPPSSGWSNTKPSTFDKNKWLWTETTIHWSDNSTTVLYSAERNPNDGAAGQDIVIDGATVMKYAVSNNNTQRPTKWYDYAEIASQITAGTWLWSMATTYYRKSESSAGSHDAGSSVNYSVSYNGTDGAAGRALTSMTEYYKATNSNSPMSKPSSASGWDDDPNLSDLTDKWGANHIYLWNMEKMVYTESDGTTTTDYTIPKILAIWTKDGDAGQGIDSIVNHYKISNSLTPPAKTDSGWSDTPVSPTASNPYLWSYETVTWVNPSSTTDTDVVMIGHFGKDGISVRAQYSANGTSWHDTFASTDKWMRTSTDNGTTWSTAMKIVGENGAETDFSFGISQYKTTDNAHTAPSDISTWSDTPVAVTEQKPYLWSKVVQKNGSGTVIDTSYIRMTGEDGTSVTIDTSNTFTKYQKGDSGTTIPTGTWQPTIPPVEQGKYLWTWVHTAYSDGSYTDVYTPTYQSNDGLPSAYINLSDSVVDIEVDENGKATKDFYEEITYTMGASGKTLYIKRVDVSTVSHVSIPAYILSPLADGLITVSGTTATLTKGGVTVSGTKATLPYGYTALPQIVVSAQDGETINEGVVEVSGVAIDKDGNEYMAKTVFSIARQYYAPALQIVLSQSTMILTQNESTKEIYLDDAYTDVSLRIGSTDITDGLTIKADVSTFYDETQERDVPSCNVKVDGNRVRITDIASYAYIPEGSTTETRVYCEKGWVDITVTYRGKPYVSRLGFYCNLLGTWKSEVENDTQKIVAQRISYVVNNGDSTKTIEQTKNTFTQMSSSVEQVSEWKEEKEDVYDGYDQRITNTNTRVSNAESNISTIRSTRPQEDIFSKGLSDWVLNDTDYPDADFDNKYPRYYAAGEIADIYSPVVALKAGEYCFSAYVPSDREFDTYGSTIVLMKGCTESDPSSGSFFPASYASTVDGDTITIQVTENERIVEKTYYRRYATFRITGNAELCSINLWGDGAKFADVVRPKLEVGSSVTPYVMTSSVVKQTADALTVQINGKASHSEVTQTANNIVAKVNETGIDIDKKKITLNSETTEISNNGQTAAMFEDGKIKADYINVATLIAQQLLTEADSSGIQVKIEKGLMEVYGKKGVANWRFGIDGSGNTVLAYYNNSGQKLYDLGPNGISSINNFYESWGEDRTKSVLTKDYNISYGTSGTLNNLVFGSAVFYRNIFSGGHNITPTYIYGARKTDTGSSVTYYGKDEDPDVTYAANSSVAREADKKEFWNKEDLSGCATTAAVDEKKIKTFIAVRVSEEPLQPINFNGMPSSEINRVLTQVKTQYYTPNESYYATLLQTAGIPFVFPTVDTVSQYPLYMRTIVDANNNTFTLLSNNKW